MKPLGWVRKTADIKTYRRDYIQKNKEKLNLLCAQRNRERRKTDEAFRKAENLDRHNRYVKRMKEKFGDGWTLTERSRNLSPEERIELKRRRNKRAYESKKLQRQSDPVAMMKHRARHAFTSAVQRGKIIRAPCSVCGDEKSEGHHPDYSKPFEVIWLCQKHHQEIHKST